MKITLKQILSSVEGMKELLNVKLPIKTAYRISKLINGKLNTELKVYEEQRLKLVEEYGDKDEEGNLSVTDPKKLKEFYKKIEELQAIEVDLDFTPISIEELGEITVEPRAVIDWLFV